MMQTDYHYQIGMTGHVSAGDVPPYRVNGLLPSPALTSPIMPESRQTYVTTLRYGCVRLTTSGCLRQWCMRLSTWPYKMAGY
jgi:hypothetical protein